MAAPASAPAPPQRLFDLVQKFTEHREAYLRPEYKEAQLRKEFIDPLLEILGWDVANTAGYAEAYKDVVHEDAIRIEGAPKTPDYSIRIGGTTDGPRFDNVAIGNRTEQFSPFVGGFDKCATYWLEPASHDNTAVVAATASVIDDGFNNEITRKHGSDDGH